jgi:flagellar biosynthesis/type III secretory pathway protein FliH
MRRSLLKHVPQDMAKPAFERFSVKPVNYYREVIHAESVQQEKAASRNAPVESRKGVEPKAAQEEIARARQEAVREGIEKGRAEAMRELQQGFELLDQSAKLLNAERTEASSRFQSQLVSLATQMAKKILDTELSLNPELLLSIVQAAMNSAKDANQVTLKVNPEDLIIVKSQLDTLKQSLGTNVSFDMKPDTQIGRGGCIIDTELGSLDARLATQLETLRSQLDERIGAKS